MTVQAPPCRAIPPPPSPLSVRMPGGLTITTSPIGVSIVTDLSAVQSIIGQLGPALAGLTPVFTLIDAVVALKDSIVAIPELLVLNVDPFTEALERLFGAIAKLAGMAPQVAVPIMAIDIIGVVTSGLRALRSVIVEAGKADDKAQELLQQAIDTGDDNLRAAAECLTAQAQATVDHAVASLGGVGTVMDSLTKLLELVPGAPDLPGLDDLDGIPLDEAVEVLDTIIAILEAIQIPGA